MNRVVALLDRTVLKVVGPVAQDFLQGLITNDISKVSRNGSVMAALLTPQGKINYEFFIAPIKGGEDGSDGYLLDTPKGGSVDLLKKLKLYKLRVDVEITDLSGSHMVVACGDAAVSAGDAEVVYPDPRSSGMGMRAVVDVEKMGDFCAGAETGTYDDYLQLRFEHQIPEGGHDYAFGDAYPHEAAYDLLDGVDFKKGCYVGQEVVSRMEHRSTVKKRIVMVEGHGDLPDAGTELRTDKTLVGVLGSSLGAKGLALLRLDRAGKAMAADEAIKADGIVVSLSIPSWASYEFPSKQEA